MRNVIIKYLLGGQLHRLSFGPEVSFETVVREINSQSELVLHSRVYVSYLDEDNDQIVLKSDHDLQECIRFFRSVNSEMTPQDDVVLRLHTHKVLPLLDWAPSLPSGDQVRDFSLQKYKCFEKTLLDFALKAEYGAMLTVETTRQLLGSLVHKLGGGGGSGSFPSFLDRIQAEFESENTNVIHLALGGLIGLRIKVKNTGNTPWPMDTELSLVSPVGVPVTLEHSPIHLGLLYPGECLTFSIVLTGTLSSSVPHSQPCQAFWKISSKQTILPFLVPVMFSFQASKPTNASPSCGSEFPLPTPPSSLTTIDGFVDLKKEMCLEYPLLH